MLPDMQEVGVAGHFQIDNYCTCLTGWCKLTIHILVNLGHQLVLDKSAERETGLRFPSAKAVGYPPWPSIWLLNLEKRHATCGEIPTTPATGNIERVAIKQGVNIVTGSRGTSETRVNY